MRKTIASLFMLLISCVVVNAQERTNKSLPVISPDKLWSLDQATGWMKGTDEQWLEGKNKIQYITLGSRDTEKFDHGFYKIGMDNFTSIEVREVKMEQRDLLLIIKKFNTHSTDHVRDVNRDESKPVIAYMVVDRNSSEVGELSKAYELNLFGFGIVEPTEDYLQKIASNLGALIAQYSWLTTGTGTTELFKFHYKTSDTNPDVARFYFSSTKDTMTDHMILPYTVPLSFDKKPLEDYYFEVPTAQIAPLANLLIKK